MASPQKAKGEEVSDSPFLNEWGFTLKDLYNLAFVFYKGEKASEKEFICLLNCYRIQNMFVKRKFYFFFQNNKEKPYKSLMNLGFVSLLCLAK